MIQQARNQLCLKALTHPIKLDAHIFHAWRCERNLQMIKTQEGGESIVFIHQPQVKEGKGVARPEWLPAPCLHNIFVQTFLRSASWFLYIISVQIFHSLSISVQTFLRLGSSPNVPLARQLEQNHLPMCICSTQSCVSVQPVRQVVCTKYLFKY